MTSTREVSTGSISQPVTEARGSAMGTTFHFALRGGPTDLIAQLRNRLIQLERRWSRFLPTSEISRMNTKPGSWHVVSADTTLLLERAKQGWVLTGGLFDPTVLDSVEALGYRACFHMMSDRVRTKTTKAADGCGEIVIDRILIDGNPNGDNLVDNIGIDQSRGGLIRLGSNTRFDPGGIGKGLAADLLVGEAMAAGAQAALVNLGGDLVCRSDENDQEPWLIVVHEPTVQADQLATIALHNGAVATSTISKRRWTVEGRESNHHLIDPRHGGNSDGVALATVVAAEGWWAEVAAKQLLIGSHSPSQSAIQTTTFDTARGAAIVIDVAGNRQHVGSIESYLR